MQRSYTYNGQIYQVNLERQPDGSFLARIDGQPTVLSAAEITPGAWLLHSGGQRHIAHVAADDDALYVHLDGNQFRLERAQSQQRRRGGSAAGGGLTAEMPGQVIDVRAAEGETVTSGQVLVVLEAMKMEIRVMAPHDGMVARMLVKSGDVVERGQLLAEVTKG